VDLGAGGAFILFILSFIFVPMTIMIKNPLPPASGAAVTMEQVAGYLFAFTKLLLLVH